jgi:hypothetical protein
MRVRLLWTSGRLDNADSQCGILVAIGLPSRWKVSCLWSVAFFLFLPQIVIVYEPCFPPGYCD